MIRLASILISAGLLAACSTNDILTLDDTPPAPVGSGVATTASSLQSAPPVAAAPAQNVARQSLAPPPAQPTAVAAPAPSTAMDPTPGQGRAPSTFGAQVAGFDTPAPPAAPAAQQAAAAPALPAATPVASSTPQTTVPAQATQPAQVASQQTAPAPSAIASAETVRFLPIIGAPSDKLEPLSLRLGDSARASGLSIAPMDDDEADLSLKGYFSAVNQDGVVSVVYVWDVIGENGRRLHRIQGNEPAAGGGFGGADPWTGVSDTMMASIGQKTVGDLMAWLDTQS